MPKPPSKKSSPEPPIKRSRPSSPFIVSQFILAFPNENNDITANAFTGMGGNINIQAKSIFGLQELNLFRLLNS